MDSIKVVHTPLDWSGVSAITSILMLFINVFLLVSVIFAYRTIRVEVKNRDSSLLLWAMEEMKNIKPDSQKIHEAGVYAHGELGSTDYEVQWSRETIDPAYRVSILMQRLSYMAMSELISKEHFAKMWGPDFSKSWTLLEPYVHHKRFLNGEKLTLKEGAHNKQFKQTLNAWHF
ncbi:MULTISPECIES: hypothetical protein [Vibrio]|uniref:hypothetical protein n=1 Tax=Vibrio TaxID=662 RepID=UPI0009385F4A|nr:MULTISPECIES: hypothetical protein [Vibrio]APP04896.1 hypothetical protein BG259_05860 [Vibrio harveyi]USD53605.1 hypothetical protein J4N44_09780 [Vibrio sp. SCSIO 43155]